MNANLHVSPALARVGVRCLHTPAPVVGLGAPRLVRARSRVISRSTSSVGASGDVGEARELIANMEEKTDSNGAQAVVDDVEGEIVKPSLANNPVVRSLALAVVILAAGRSTTLLSQKWAIFTHVIAFGAWFGASLWVSLIGGLTMFKNMPRQMFGRVQAKLFPKYFFLASTMTGVMLLTPITAAKPYAVIIALISSLVNWLLVEPRATKVMFERYELENTKPRDEKKIKELYKQFSMYHGASSIFNLTALLAGFGHAWTLAAAVVV
ncbi:hypothetical protein BSKO_05355 [Bryopsis sp. KO-2023]|nr:hypothetical protein BSKO_05355 [Bryopsis sp. KO-2023]